MKANDNWKIGATAFFTERNLDQGTNDLQYIQTDTGQGTNTGLTATSAVDHITSIGTPYMVDTPNGPRAYINKFTVETANTYDSTRSEPARQSTWSVNPTVSFKNENWSFTGAATLSRAEVLANQIELDVIENPYKAGSSLTTTNGISASIYTGGDDLSNAVYQVTTPNTLHVSPGGYPVATAASQATQAADALGNKFGATGTNGHADNFLDAVQFDGERFLQGDFLSSIAFGARYEKDKYESTGSRNTAIGALTQNITPAMVSPEPAIGDFFGGNAPGMNTNWFQGNVQQILAAITPVNTAALPAQFQLNDADGVFITPYGLVNNYWDPNYWNNNFTNQSDISSAYIMAKFDTHLSSIRVRGNLGLRYEGYAEHDHGARLQQLLQHPGHRRLPGAQPQPDRAHLQAALSLCAAVADRGRRPDRQPGGALRRLFDLCPAAAARHRADHLGHPARTDDRRHAAGLCRQPDLYGGGRRHQPETLHLGFLRRVAGMVQPPRRADRHRFLREADQGLYRADNRRQPALPRRRQDQRHRLRPGARSAASVRTASARNTFNTTSGTQNGLVLISGMTNLSLQRAAELRLPAGFWKNFGGAMNYSYTTVSGKDATGKAITLPSVSKDNVNLIGYYEDQEVRYPPGL